MERKNIISKCWLSLLLVCSFCFAYSQQVVSGKCPTCNGSGLAVWFTGEVVQCYSCSGTGVFTYVLPDPNSFTNSTNDNSQSGTTKRNSNSAAEEIRQLEWKIKQEQNSLAYHEESYRKNPSPSTARLIQSTKELIRTYQNRISELRRRL